MHTGTSVAQGAQCAECFYRRNATPQCRNGFSFPRPVPHATFTQQFGNSSHSNLWHNHHEGVEQTWGMLGKSGPLAGHQGD